MSNPAMAPDASQSFHRASRARRKAPRTRPIPIRFTEAELAILRKKAGKLPLSTYMRQELLGRKVDKRRAVRQPKVNQKEYAVLLASLGNSRLSSNLNQIAKAINTGTLDVSQDVEQQLKDAAMAVQAMRETLLYALGMRSK